MKIGIIGAMTQETQLIAPLLENSSVAEDSGVTITFGKLHGHEVALCTCGVGKTLAAAAAQLLISKYGCECIINTGVAGNTDPELGVGDVVIGQTLVFHDADMLIASHYAPFTEQFSSDPRLCDAAEGVCGALGEKCKRGRIATGDVFVCDSEVKNDIVRRTGCLCVEMEGAAIANIAARCGVPFLVLRVMSDNADENIAQALHVQDFDVSAYCRQSLALIEALLGEM